MSLISYVTSKEGYTVRQCASFQGVPAIGDEGDLGGTAILVEVITFTSDE